MKLSTNEGGKQQNKSSSLNFYFFFPSLFLLIFYLGITQEV